MTTTILAQSPRLPIRTQVEVAPPPTYQEAISQPPSTLTEMQRLWNFLQSQAEANRRQMQHIVTRGTMPETPSQPSPRNELGRRLAILKQHARVLDYQRSLVMQAGKRHARVVSMLRATLRQRVAAQQAETPQQGGVSQMPEATQLQEATQAHVTTQPQEPAQAIEATQPQETAHPQSVTTEQTQNSESRDVSPVPSTTSDTSNTFASETRPRIIDRVFENIDEPGASNYFVQTTTNGNTVIVMVAVEDILKYVSSEELEVFEMDFTCRRLEAQRAQLAQPVRGRGKPRKVVSTVADSMADMQISEPNTEVTGESSRSKRSTATRNSSEQSATSSKGKRKAAAEISEDNVSPKKPKNPKSTIVVEPEYEVEAIVGDVEVDDGVGGILRKYVVKWKGYSEDDTTLQTLEDLENSAELVQEYWASKHAQKQHQDDDVDMTGA